MRRRLVHAQRAASFSTRIAAALNSAVPDFGSVASIVSWFTSTSSGKWKVMNASPARRDGSIRTGASTVPRRDETRTTSPSETSSRSASSGERSSDSPRWSGERYRFDCAPVLKDSRRRPVVSRIGKSASSASKGGFASTTLNGASGPSTGSAHSRPWRKSDPGCSSSGHGHWSPRSASSRS